MMSDIKSAHVGHHVRKGRILASFLKSGVPMDKHPDRTHLRAFKSSVKQASAYEVCDRTRTFLHTPKTLETCKKNVHLI